MLRRLETHFGPDVVFAIVGTAGGVLALLTFVPMLGLCLFAGELSNLILPLLAPVTFGAALVGSGARIRRNERTGFLVCGTTALLVPGALWILVRLTGYEPSWPPFALAYALAVVSLAYCAARLVDWGPRPA